MLKSTIACTLSKVENSQRDNYESQQDNKSQKIMQKSSKPIISVQKYNEKVEKIFMLPWDSKSN